MRMPRFRIRTLMIVVGAVALLFALLVYLHDRQNRFLEKAVFYRWAEDFSSSEAERERFIATGKVQMGATDRRHPVDHAAIAAKADAQTRRYAGAAEQFERAYRYP